MLWKRGTVETSRRRYHVFFWLRRKTGVDPSAPPADERAHIGPTGVSELARHPGARRFVYSGTVNDQRAVMLQAERARRADSIVWRNAYGAARLERLIAICAVGAGVDESDGRLTCPQLAQLVDRYALGKWLRGTDGLVERWIERRQRSATWRRMTDDRWQPLCTATQQKRDAAAVQQHREEHDETGDREESLGAGQPGEHREQHQ